MEGHLYMRLGLQSAAHFTPCKAEGGVRGLARLRAAPGGEESGDDFVFACPGRRRSRRSVGPRLAEVVFSPSACADKPLVASGELTVAAWVGRANPWRGGECGAVGINLVHRRDAADGGAFL